MSCRSIVNPASNALEVAKKIVYRDRREFLDIRVANRKAPAAGREPHGASRG